MLDEYTFEVLRRTRNILDENKRLSQYEYELSLNCFQFGGGKNIQPIILKKQINLEKSRDRQWQLNELSKMKDKYHIFV